MKRTEKVSVISESLSSLIEKFSHSDVIAEMEKEYQSAPTKLVSTSLIDDNSIVESAIFRNELIDSFAETLRSKGFFNPLVIQTKEDGRYELILGRKRLLAAKKAGIVSLPCAIVDVEEEEMLLMLLADTRDQREGNVVEMALIYEALMKKYGYTQQTLADLSHQSRCQVTNILRVLRLPLNIRKEICLGTLSYGHAKAIASMPKGEMEEMVRRIHKNNLSVRETENFTRELTRNCQIDERKKKLEKQYKAKVEIRSSSITFRFESKEEQENFLRVLYK